jgi:hypothetical protein
VERRKQLHHQLNDLRTKFLQQVPVFSLEISFLEKSKTTVVTTTLGEIPAIVI